MPTRNTHTGMRVQLSQSAPVRAGTSPHAPHTHTHSAGWLRPFALLLLLHLPRVLSIPLSAAALSPRLSGTHPQRSPPAQTAQDPGRRRLFGRESSAPAQRSDAHAPDHSRAEADSISQKSQRWERLNMTSRDLRKRTRVRRVAALDRILRARAAA